ncbi:MAG: hypothetical protein GX591_11980 [Planctomycetes bacterium]|nr:hypothetical protein [Planctomycetota bacterium]
MNVWKIVGAILGWLLFLASLAGGVWWWITEERYQREHRQRLRELLERRWKDGRPL